MNRKLVGGAVLLVAGLVAVWFLWLRGGDKAPGGDADGSARTGKVAAPGPAPGPREAAIPRGATRGGWFLDPDREGALRLEGQVVGPDGKGVAGADVWLSSVPKRHARSEDDGSFAFDKLVERTYELSARSGELIGGPVTYKLTGKSDPVVVRLGEGAAVVVTVVDETQRPIEGAEVRGGALAERAAVRTDAKGEATLRPVHPGYVGARATAAGYAPSAGFTTIGSPGAVGRLTRSPAASSTRPARRSGGRRSRSAAAGGASMTTTTTSPAPRRGRRSPTTRGGSRSRRSRAARTGCRRRTASTRRRRRTRSRWPIRR
jgi:hypothetical protein